MAKGLIEDTTMTAIANAIRAKTGGTEPLLPSAMATAIDGIQTGGGGKVWASGEQVGYLYGYAPQLGSKYRIQATGKFIWPAGQTNLKVTVGVSLTSYYFYSVSVNSKSIIEGSATSGSSTTKDIPITYDMVNLAAPPTEDTIVSIGLLFDGSPHKASDVNVTVYNS